MGRRSVFEFIIPYQYISYSVFYRLINVPYKIQFSWGKNTSLIKSVVRKLKRYDVHVFQLCFYDRHWFILKSRPGSMQA